LADLLKGDNAGVIAENIRQLRQSGLSEQEATARAHQYARGEDDSVESEEEPSVEESAPSSGRQFVVVTSDFSGLGWAKKLQEEGETVTLAVKYDEEDDPKLKKMMKMVGEGWLEVVELSKAVNTLQSDNTYWIFAQNCFVEEAKQLLKANQKMFPPSIELCEKMEHDRQYAVEIAEEAGLPSPPTHEFTTREEGLAHLDSNTHKAYVFKPDDGKFNYMTFVPVRRADEDANRELYTYLQHMRKDPGPYVLQERIAMEDALEVNCELWIYEGEPFLASVGLEVKRKNTYDLGEMCGCGGDFIQFIPIESELVKQTVGKLLPFYKEQNYTGFADVNVIFTKDGQPYFLEVCNRFGYNSHPNMFLALATDTFGNIMADFIDGNVEGMEGRFRQDVGCSLTMFLDHPREGLPVHVDAKYVEQFFPFDGYKEDDDQILLTGYSDEVGIFLDHGKDIPAAWKAVRDKIVFEEAVSFPDCYFRYDLADDNYYNAPILRMKELKKRGLLP
jgi:phosphoribosylamine-glycine ligase